MAVLDLVNQHSIFHCHNQCILHGNVRPSKSTFCAHIVTISPSFMAMLDLVNQHFFFHCHNQSILHGNYGPGKSALHLVTITPSLTGLMHLCHNKSVTVTTLTSYGEINWCMEAYGWCCLATKKVKLHEKTFFFSPKNWYVSSGELPVWLSPLNEHI